MHGGRRHAQGIDRLAQRVRGTLGEDPQTSSLFVFANRNATRIKALWFDCNGYCLLYKRLHRAVFELLPSGGDAAVQINATQLATLLGALLVSYAEICPRLA